MEFTRISAGRPCTQPDKTETKTLSFIDPRLAQRVFVASLKYQLAFVLVLLLFGGPAAAFDSFEHQEMSNIAVEVAKVYIVRHPNGGFSDVAVKALSDIQPYYGDITQCVDYFLYPEKILAFGWRHRTKQRSLEMPDTEVASGSGIPSDSDKNAPFLADLQLSCQEEGSRYMQATHGNHAHFQHDLLMSLRVWHFMAVALGREEGNYFGALLTNAIADHYLQDFFAPGHIVTPRDRLTDLQATAGHDLANITGAIFSPHLTPRMAAILSDLCGTTLGQAVPPGKECVVPEVYEKAVVGPRGKLSVSDIPDQAGALSSGLMVMFRGDGRLADAEQARQRLLLLLAQVSSILDVLDGRNNLKKVNFDYFLGTGFAIAEVEFGEYDLTREGRRYADLINEKDTSDRKSDKQIQTSTESSSFRTCALISCPGRLYALRSRSPVVSIGAEHASQVTGTSHSREMLSLEVSTAGRMWDATKASGRWLEGVEFVPTLGYAAYAQGALHGNGPTGRVMMSIPETEFSFGAYARWFGYKASGTSSRHFSYGLRAESGFSSYFTFYIAGGLDYGLRTDGSLRRGLIMGGGVRIGAPTTRLGVTTP